MDLPRAQRAPREVGRQPRAGRPARDRRRHPARVGQAPPPEEVVQHSLSGGPAPGLALRAPRGLGGGGRGRGRAQVGDDALRRGHHGP
ncbi:MAG: hypothetical protein ACK559_33170, partial [bacterium]